MKLSIDSVKAEIEKSLLGTAVALDSAEVQRIADHYASALRKVYPGSGVTVSVEGHWHEQLLDDGTLPLRVHWPAASYYEVEIPFPFDVHGDTICTGCLFPVAECDCRSHIRGSD